MYLGIYYHRFRCVQYCCTRIIPLFRSTLLLVWVDVEELIRKDLYLARLRKLPDEYGPVRIDVKHFWPSYFNREFVFRRTYTITKYFQFFFDKKTKNLKIQIFWIRETLEERSRNGSWTRVWRPKTTSIFDRMRGLHYACFSFCGPWVLKKP